MAEIIEINEKTWRIEEGMVRFFVLEGAEKAVMIDSGMNMIQKLIEGATEIADGTAQGTEAEMFGNRFMHYKFSHAGFFGELS
ncbi:MAG: hypothetical protein IKH46_04825 [Lachnospiraceae bacterium]|nr:hypothetical protein [Lachnospiraceae bacterium]